MSSLSSNLFGGEQLSKQHSAHSLIPKPSLSDYNQILRSNSSRESSYLEIRNSSSSRVWERKWVVFENGQLRMSPNPLSSQNDITLLPMENVELLRSNNNDSEPLIVIKTSSGEEIQLKFPDKDVMKRWLFEFQKSVALVLIHILEARNNALNQSGGRTTSTGGLLDGSKIIHQESEYGHGNYTNVARRHSGTAGLKGIEDFAIGGGVGGGIGGGGGGRAQSLIDDSSVFDLNRWKAEFPSPNSKSRDANNLRMMAISPAIPIDINLGEDEEVEYRGRVASSYRDEDNGLSPMADLLHRDYPDYDDEDDDEEPDHITVSTQENDDEDDEGMMFEMDENVGNSTPNRSRTVSTENNRGIGRKSPSSNSSTPRSSFSTRSSESKHKKFPGVGKSGVGYRWRGGHCTKLGKREKNEDRFVVLPNIHDRSYNAEESKLRRGHSSSSGGTGGQASSSYSALSRSIMSPSTLTMESTKHQYGGGTEKSCGYFAVYDGHCGDSASIFCEQQLLDKVYRHSEFHSNLEKAIIETCIAIDTEFLQWCKKNRKYSGTTALGAFLSGSKLTVFCIGDSMAVMSSAGKAIVMSDSHKPDRLDEQSRIKRANGWITEEKELYLSRLHQMDYSDPLAIDRAKNMNWVTIHRVCGELAVSRSIGDPDYKGFTPGAKVDAYFGWPDGHEQVFHADLIIPDPECKTHSIGPEDEFIILATDGIWDVLSPEEAVKHVHDVFASQKSPSEAAEELCNMAIRLGTSDNVTVVIAQFMHS